MTRRSTAKHVGRRNVTSGPTSMKELARRMHARGNSAETIAGSVRQSVHVVTRWLAELQLDHAGKREAIQALAHGDDSDDAVSQVRQLLSKAPPACACGAPHYAACRCITCQRWHMTCQACGSLPAALRLARACCAKVTA